ncbi:hypothetical protein HI914_06535 [Erysiphe necator]|nr:hypothetical protein HI914_06535 [Erysiphe necator]
MHTFHFSYLLCVAIFFALTKAEKTEATNLKNDAFGPTYYGFKCSFRIYRKFKIYEAVKNLCDAMVERPDVKEENSFKVNGYRQPWQEIYEKKIIDFSKQPLFMQPILHGDQIFPSDLPPHLRVVKNHLGESENIDPGPDRLVINDKCNIIGAFTDFDYMNDEYGGRIEPCTVLNFPEDAVRSFS